MLVTPIFPAFSAIIDPLSYYFMPEELVGHIVSGVEVGKEKFFYNVAYEISLIVDQALVLLAKNEGKLPLFNLNDVKNRISRSELEKLKAEIDSIDSEEARQLSSDMQKILDSPPDYYGKVSSSLRVALMELTSGNIGKIIGQADENRFLKRLEEGRRVIMIVQLGSLITRKAAFTVGVNWKDPRTTLTFPIWMRVFPNGRVLNILRNGIDVAISIHRRSLKQRRKIWKRLFPIDYIPETLDFNYCFKLWEQHIEYIDEKRALIPAGQYLEMRYEDLLAEPWEQMRRLWFFLGADPETEEAKVSVTDWASGNLMPATAPTYLYGMDGKGRPTIKRVCGQGGRDEGATVQPWQPLQLERDVPQNLHLTVTKRPFQFPTAPWSSLLSPGRRLVISPQ